MKVVPHPKLDTKKPPFLHHVKRAVHLCENQILIRRDIS